MIMILDFMPKHCPNCGKEITIDKDKYLRQDWNINCSFVCTCGLNYQLANADDILEAATRSGGDLKG